MDGRSVVRRVGIVAAVLVLATLGGCNRTNKQATLAAAEAAGLREQNASLEAQLGERNNKIAELEGRLSVPQPVTGYPNDTGYPPVTRANRGNGGGGSGTFSEGRDGYARATVSGDVLFDSGQVTVKAGAKRELDQIAGEIKRTYSRAEVEVQGYTDSDPIKKSKWQTNERLSQERANAVRNYLVSKGVSESRINAVGMGSASPKNSKAASRRVEVVILQ